MTMPSSCPVCGGPSAPDAEVPVLGGCPILVCKDCSHRFAAVERPPDAAYESLYAEGYYRETIIGETLRHVDDDFAEHPTYRPFFRVVDVRRHPRLLDVACGSGRFCRAAERHGWQVTGIDVSATAISVASKLSQGQFFAMSLDEAAQRLGTFDVVTAFEFVEHVTDPKETLRKMMRLVRSGGILLLTVPCWDWPGVKGGAHPEGLPPFHLQFFVRTSLRRLLTGCGLKSVVVAGIRGSGKREGLLGPLRRVHGWFLPPPGLYAAGTRPETPVR